MCPVMENNTNLDAFREFREIIGKKSLNSYFGQHVSIELANCVIMSLLSPPRLLLHTY